MKNSMTPSGIEPQTFRFAAQHLNYCATAVPKLDNYFTLILMTVSFLKERLRPHKILWCVLLLLTVNTRSNINSWDGKRLGHKSFVSF